MPGRGVWRDFVGRRRCWSPAKYWLAVLTELRNRGVKDVFFVVCEDLKGLPDSVNAAFPRPRSR